MILERHFTITDLPQPLSIRAALQHWLIPRKWQHELRVQRSILVNNTYQPFNHLVHDGDQIDLTLNLQLPQQHYLPAAQVNFTVVYEDSDLLIINKPAGIKTHPNVPQETQTLFNQVRTYLNKQPLMIHRLDKLTSGLIMVGKNPLVIPILERQLAQKTMQRQYLAVTAYQAQVPKQGSIIAPIGRRDLHSTRRCLDSQGSFAQTDYRILQHNRRYALIQLNLKTGRTHQIRLHLQKIGLPILGDPLYGNEPAARLYLHAMKLTYQIPFTAKQRQVETLAPSEFYHLTT